MVARKSAIDANGSLAHNSLEFDIVNQQGPRFYKAEYYNIK